MSEQWRQLSFITPDRVSAERTPDPCLHEQTVETRQFFREQAEKGIIDTTDPFVTAQLFVWQYIDYYPARPNNYSDAARGYLMVEPEDIPLATSLVDIVYQKRKAQGSLGQFKWLTRKLPPANLVSDTREWWHEVHNDEMVGSYDNLDTTDPRIVLYEYSLEDIQDILSELVALNEWQTIEARRRAAFSDVPPIRGDDCFTDEFGNEWYSLSFDRNKGHSRKN